MQEKIPPNVWQMTDKMKKRKKKQKLKHSKENKLLFVKQRV